MGRPKYKRITMKEHPNAYFNGQIAEHRYVMSQYLNRPLKEGELVHHIDNNTLNNDIKNLQLITRQEHAASHLKGRKFSKEHRKKISKSRLGKKTWCTGKKMSTKQKKNFLFCSKDYIPWNKERHIQTNTGRTHFKKGHKYYPHNNI